MLSCSPCLLLVQPNQIMRTAAYIIEKNIFFHHCLEMWSYRLQWRAFSLVWTPYQGLTTFLLQCRYHFYFVFLLSSLVVFFLRSSLVVFPIIMVFFACVNFDFEFEKTFQPSRTPVLLVFFCDFSYSNLFINYFLFRSLTVKLVFSKPSPPRSFERMFHRYQ